MAHFVIPEEVENRPVDAWGPLSALEAAGQPLLPYQPYNKNERLGRACDWNKPQKPQDFVYGRSSQGDAAQTFAFTYKEEDEDESFRAVGRTASSIAAAQKRRAASTHRGGWRAGGAGGAGGARFARGSGGAGAARGRRDGARARFRTFHSRSWDDKMRVPTESTITLMPTGEKKATVALSALGKTPFGMPAAAGVAARELRERDMAPLPRATELETCGQLCVLVPSRYQQATPRKPQPLGTSSRLSFSVTTSADPVMERLVARVRAEESGKTTIFATDSIVAALMTAQRSVLPWCVSVQRDGPCIFLNTREGSTIDLLSVDETAGSQDFAADAAAPNSAGNLWREATCVADLFAQHVVAAARATPAVRYPQGCPFLTDDDRADGKDAAPVAYRYRRFALSDQVDLVVRCEAQALARACAPDAIDGNIVEVCTLNEWNPAATKWRASFENRSGLILATELKNNACRMARNTAKALLAGASTILIGFVTRRTPSKSEAHDIIGTIPYPTATLMGQLNLTERLLWGTADQLLQLLVPLPQGDYVLTKQDSSSNIYLYSTPEAPADE